MTSESPTADTFAQRLVVRRLASPGMLDRRALQRTHDRLSPPSGASGLARLFRRVEPTSPSTESLPLAHVDRSAAPGTADAASAAEPAAGLALPTAAASDRAPASTRPRDGGASPAAALPSIAAGVVAKGVVQRVAAAGGHDDIRSSAASGVASPLTRDLVARQTPGISRTPEPVARRVTSAAGLLGGAAPTSRLLARSAASAGSQPAVAAGAVSPGTVQRVADPGAAVRARPAGEPASVARGAPSAGDVSASSLPQRSPSATPATGATRAASLPAAVVSRVAPTPAPLLMRSADVARPLPVVPALPRSVGSPAIGAAPAPLLLRKPDASATVGQPRVQAPSTGASSSGVIARTADSPGYTPNAPAAPAMSEGARASDWDIDWIAEQVGNRLARRLEIERERMGVRQWRQVG